MKLLKPILKVRYDHQAGLVMLLCKLNICNVAMTNSILDLMWGQMLIQKVRAENGSER